MTIGTWNISNLRLSKTYQQFDYFNKENIGYFLNVLRKENLDVICLQENLANGVKSYSEEICSRLGYQDYFDTLGNTSFIDTVYKESMSIISKFPIKKGMSIKTFNPNWHMRLPDGSSATSFDKWVQIAKINGITLGHVHFLPEKLFGQNYSEGVGLDYLEKNFELLRKIHSLDVMCGDFNTVSIKEVFGEFMEEFKLINGLENLGTRPIRNGNVLVQDTIFYRRDFRLKKKKVVETENDHYLAWIDVEVRSIEG